MLLKFKEEENYNNCSISGESRHVRRAVYISGDSGTLFADDMTTTTTTSVFQFIDTHYSYSPNLSRPTARQN